MLTEGKTAQTEQKSPIFFSSAVFVFHKSDSGRKLLMRLSNRLKKFVSLCVNSRGMRGLQWLARNSWKILR